MRLSTMIRRSTVAAVIACTAALVLAPAAHAVPPDQVGVYPAWEVSGSSGAFTASPVFPASAGFPEMSVSSNATSITTPGGTSTWYNGSTGFGVEYGSSRYQPYLLINTAAGRSPSTTTLTFAADPPAGWGFALGDVDADWVFIQGYADEAATIPLTIDQLGFEAAENFCVGSPRPSSCSIPGLLFESPVWVTSPETFDGIDYTPSTLRGSTERSDTVTTLDSAGAHGWFRPTVPVRALTLLFGPRDGFPTYTLTLASPAPKTTITGSVTPPPGGQVPPGTAIAVAEPDGTPLLDLEGAPVIVPVDADGTYAIEAEQRDAYLLDPIVPSGFVDPPPFLVPADSAEVTAPPVELMAVDAVPEPTTPPEVEEEGEGLLAASGSDSIPTVVWLSAAGMLAVGLVLTVIGRRTVKPIETHLSRSPIDR